MADQMGAEAGFLSKYRSLQSSSKKPQAALPTNPQTMRKYGIVVFGASGFTGKRVLVELACSARDVKWAAAGRNKAKIEVALAEVGLSGVDIIVADVADPESMTKMAAQTEVLINCTGPYRFYGEPTVKACVGSGTHYVDITGEPEFMERSELLFHRDAVDKGIFVVSGCGFDSVPADEGFLFTTEQLGSTSSVESFLGLRAGTSGVTLHSTTLECAVHGMSDTKKLKDLRDNLQKTRPRDTAPPLGPKLKVKDLYWEPRVDGMVAKFPGSDAMVVKKSNLYRSARLYEPQVQYAAYMTIGNYWNALRLGVYQAVIKTSIMWDCGKDLVLQNPEAFTAGVFSHQGPNEKQMAETSFEFTFFAKGWERKKPATTDPTEVPNYEVVTKVSGPEPGYIATPIFVVAAALTIILDKISLPYNGGVLTPSEAFYGSRFRPRLIARGIRFEVISKETIEAPAPAASKNSKL